MREVICIGVGQAGVQISNAAWELFCIEHGIESNGTKKESTQILDDGVKTFFEQVKNGNYVPRAINIDLEPTVIDEIRTASYRDLWHPDYLINSNEDAANNFARGHFTVGRVLMPKFMEVLRKCVHNAECLQGFIILNSYGGGTGSGLSTLILENLEAEFSKGSKFQKCIFPAPKLSTAIVEPYNALLTSSKSIENTDLVTLIDNEAVYDICGNNLNIPRPSYSSINRLIAQIFSAMTVSIRFGASLDHNLTQLQTNLVPFPRIHFPTTNYAPIVSRHAASHQRLSIVDLTRNLFDPRNQFVKICLRDGLYIACSMQYRGLITPRQVNVAIREMKQRDDIKFVEWCPTGFKLGISPMPPTIVPGSELGPIQRNCSMYSNNTAICQLFNRLSMKFDLLFTKRAFVHWYVGEGMEEGEFNESRSTLEQLKKDYCEISQATEDGPSIPKDPQVSKLERYRKIVHPPYESKYHQNVGSQYKIRRKLNQTENRFRNSEISFKSDQLHFYKRNNKTRVLNRESDSMSNTLKGHPKKIVERDENQLRTKITSDDIVADIAEDPAMLTNHNTPDFQTNSNAVNDRHHKIKSKHHHHHKTSKHQNKSKHKNRHEKT